MAAFHDDVARFLESTQPDEAAPIATPPVAIAIPWNGTANQ